MDKRELSQLKPLIKEIEYLRRQLDNAESLIETRRTTDSVTGSLTEWPYVLHTIKISGVDMQDYELKVKRLRNSLKRRIDELMDKVAEMQEYIAGIPDSDIRLILQCRFINGMTWEQIEAETGIPITTAKRKYRWWRNFM